MVTDLGIFATNDLPKPNALGVYKVPNRGWFAMVYTTSYGPYARREEAAEYVERCQAAGAGMFGSWMEIVWMLGKIAAATIGLVTLGGGFIWLVCAATLRQ